jgi:uncharacterized membrane protein
VLNLRRQFFWLVTATILAICCHVAYLLFVPSRSFSAAIDAAMGESQNNRFTILGDKAQLKLIPYASTNSIVGVCKFNVSAGPVKFSARLPEGYWNFAVYTIRGRQVYAINDTQADTNSFSVVLSHDDGLIAQLLGGSAEVADIAGDDIGWRIAIADREGLAVLWMTVADPLLRKEVEDVMKQSRCARADL